MNVHELALYVCLRIRGIRMVRFSVYSSDMLFLWPEKNVFLTDTDSIMRAREEFGVVGSSSYSDFEKARSRYGFFNAFNYVYLDYVFSDQNRWSTITLAQMVSDASFYEVVVYEKLLVKGFFYFIICPVLIVVNILYILTLK